MHVPTRSERSGGGEGHDVPGDNKDNGKTTNRMKKKGAAKMHAPRSKLWAKIAANPQAHPPTHIDRQCDSKLMDTLANPIKSDLGAVVLYL